MGKAEDEVKKIREQIEATQEEMNELVFATRDFANEARDAAKAVYENSVQAAAVSKAFKDIGKAITDQASIIEDVLDGTKDINDLAKEQIKFANSKRKLEVEYSQALAKAGISQKSINKLVKGQGDLTSIVADELGDISKEQATLLSMFEEQVKVNSDNEKIMEEMRKRAKEIDKGMGAFGKTAMGLQKTLNAIGLGKLGERLGIEDAIKSGRKLSAELTKGGSKQASFTDKIKVGNKVMGEMGKSLGKSLGPLAIVATLADVFKKVDKQSAEFAKNQGISAKESVQLRVEMSEIARNSDDVAVNSERMMEAQASLNSFFGSSVKFSGQMAADFASLAKRTNMTAETQGVIALETMRTGKSAKDVTTQINLQVMEMNKQKGLQMSVKSIQDAIGKTSKALQLTFKGSTKELVNQVMQAKALGATMEQVEQISSSLLDFESSIAAELEAELLLGKDINLEKAREAALRGESGKVAEEVMKNTAIMNAFETKNVIAQEAAAKALGMSRDQLAEMVMEQQKLESLRKFGAEDMNAAQEKYNALRESGMTAEQAAAEVGDEALASQLESLGASEKFEETMARVQELFVQLVPPIMELITPIIDILLPALTFIGGIISAMTEGINMFAQGLKEGSALAYVLAGVLGLVALPLIVSAVSGIFSTFSQIPFGIGIPLAIATIAGFFSQVSKAKSTVPKKAGDMFSPADGKTQVSTKEGGLFELSPNDDLVAAPGAGDAMKSERGGGARRDAALISEIQTLIGINRQILAKSPVIEMSGNKVGEGVSQAERAIQ